MIQVHPNAIIHADTELADGVVVGPNCVIDKGVSIGSGTVLEANVVIGPDVKIGSNNHFYPNCAIGGNPQLLSLGSEDKIGRLIIGDNNIIREQATIHPSIHENELTKVGNENMIMVGVHLGHDCVIEDKTVLSNYVQISGHCRICTGVWLSGMVLLHQFVTVGRWCYAAGLAGINHDVPSFMIVSGHYPPKVRGVNKRGMARAGLDKEQQKQIFKAYKRLYRNNKPLIENAREMAKDDSLTDEVKEIVGILLKSNEHRFGRYLETLRH